MDVGVMGTWLGGKIFIVCLPTFIGEPQAWLS